MSAIFSFSGLLNVGKDHVAEVAGLQPVPLPEPIYRAVEKLLADKPENKDKKNPIVRRAMQLVGSWGRMGNEGKEEMVGDYTKAELTYKMQREGHTITGLDLPWGDFGRDPDFWIKNAMIRLRETQEKGIDCVMPNVRFQRELELLGTIGAKHMLIMCPEDVRRERMKRPYDPAIDLSETEMYAVKLTESVWEKGVASVPMHGVIWNDDTTPPVRGMKSVDQFIAEVQTLKEKEREGGYLTRTMAVPLMTRETNSSSLRPL